MSTSKFYAEQWSDNLRLGDIVTGYVLADPHHIEPIVNSFVKIQNASVKEKGKVQ